MIAVRARRTQGTLHTKIVGKDTGGNEVHRDEKSRQLPAPTGNGMITVQEGVTISYHFNSVRIDIGIELPWDLSPGDGFDRRIRKAYDTAYTVVQEELTQQAGKMEKLLRELSGK